MRRSTLKVAAVFLVTFAICGGLTAAYFRRYGVWDTTLATSLRVSAWAGMLIFLCIFVARPLHQLRGGVLTAGLVRNRRYLGVAFAAVMSVHLVLLLYVNGFVPNVPGGGAYLFILLMLLTSFDRAVAVLGPRRWRLLHTAGLYWIGFIFAYTIAAAMYREPQSGLHHLFVGLILAAVGVRIAAIVKVRRQSSLPGTPRSRA